MTFELAVILVAIIGYGAGFVSAIFYRWIQQADKSIEYWDERIKEIKNSQLMAFQQGKMNIDDIRRINPDLTQTPEITFLTWKDKKESLPQIIEMNGHRWKLNDAKDCYSQLEDIRHKCWTCGREFLTASVATATHCPFGCGEHVERFDIA